MVSETSDLHSVRLFFRQALKNRWLILVVQIALTIAAAIIFFVLPKEYRSATTIKIEREKVINPLTRGLAVTSQMEERLRTLQEEVLSRNHLEKVSSRLELGIGNDDPLRQEEVLAQMKRNISVDLIRVGRATPDSFQISYVGGEPRQTRDVTNALAEIFIEDSLTYKENEADAAVRFLQSQLDIYREKLEGSESALRLFEEKHVDELPATKAAHLARLDLLKSSLEDTRQNIRQLKIQKDFLLKRISGEKIKQEYVVEEETVVANPVQVLLDEKRKELKKMLRDYSEKYPDVISLRQEIADLEAELAEKPTIPAREVASPSDLSAFQETLVTQLQGVDLELQTAKTRESQLIREIEKYQSKVQSIPKVEQELARLKRDYDVNSDIYEMFLRRLEEARVSRELETAQKGEVFRIIEAAALPLNPIRPKRLNVVLMGIAVGLVVNMLLTWWLRERDTSFYDAAQAQRILGLPVIACIPRISGGRERLLRWVRNFVFVLFCAAYGVGVFTFIYWGRLETLIKTVNGGV
jgi:polysaccharide chain length determinant protein (PEP-CTERM system associated)